MDFTPYVESWRARLLEEQARLDADAERARLAAGSMAELLRGAGAQRVWLVGSVARGTSLPRSDIDLLAEGLRSEQVTSLAARAADLAGRWVDILRIEELNADWLAYHHRWAVPLSP